MSYSTRPSDVSHLITDDEGSALTSDDSPKEGSNSDSFKTTRTSTELDSLINELNASLLSPSPSRPSELLIRQQRFNDSMATQSRLRRRALDPDQTAELRVLYTPARGNRRSDEQYRTARNSFDLSCVGGRSTPLRNPESVNPQRILFETESEISESPPKTQQTGGNDADDEEAVSSDEGDGVYLEERPQFNAEENTDADRLIEFYTEENSERAQPSVTFQSKRKSRQSLQWMQYCSEDDTDHSDVDREIIDLRAEERNHGEEGNITADEANSNEDESVEDEEPLEDEGPQDENEGREAEEQNQEDQTQMESFVDFANRPPVEGTYNIVNVNAESILAESTIIQITPQRSNNVDRSRTVGPGGTTLWWDSYVGDESHRTPTANRQPLNEIQPTEETPSTFLPQEDPDLDKTIRENVERPTSSVRPLIDESSFRIFQTGTDSESDAENRQPSRRPPAPTVIRTKTKEKPIRKISYPGGNSVFRRVTISDQTDTDNNGPPPRRIIPAITEESEDSEEERFHIPQRGLRIVPDEAKNRSRSKWPNPRKAEQHRIDWGYLQSIEAVTVNVDNRDRISAQCFEIFNRRIFKGQLPSSIKIIWDNRFVKKAGEWSIEQGRIRLGTKVLDSGLKVRDVMLHEMCHAAVGLIDNNRFCRAHTGPFAKWGKLALKVFPDLPAVTTYHTFSVKTRYKYVCQKCAKTIHRVRDTVDVVRCCCTCGGNLVGYQNERRMSRTATHGVFGRPARPVPNNIPNDELEALNRLSIH